MFYTRFPSGVHGLSLYSFTFIFKLLICLFWFCFSCQSYLRNSIHLDMGNATAKIVCIDGSTGLPVTVVGGVNANTWHTVVWWQWPRCGLLIYSPRLAPAQLPVLDHCFILSSYSGISQHFVSILEPTKQRQYLVIPQLAPASGRRDQVELDFVKISSCLVKVLCSKADSKPTSCLNSKVYEVDVYKCLVGWFISLRFDPNVNEITFRSPSGKKWSIEGALEPPLAHLSGQHTQHNTQRRNWAENQSFSFFCFTINTISSAWSGL